MKIEKFISWAESNDYPTASFENPEYETLLKEAIKSGEAPKFGMDHQQSSEGVPLYSDGTVMQCSFRSYGKIAFEALHPGENDMMGYSLYAWTDPDSFVRSVLRDEE